MEIYAGGIDPQICALCGLQIAFYYDLSSDPAHAAGWMHFTEYRRWLFCDPLPEVRRGDADRTAQPIGPQVTI